MKERKGGRMGRGRRWNGWVLNRRLTQMDADSLGDGWKLTAEIAKSTKGKRELRGVFERLGGVCSNWQSKVGDCFQLLRAGANI